MTMILQKTVDKHAPFVEELRSSKEFLKLMNLSLNAGLIVYYKNNEK